MPLTGGAPAISVGAGGGGGPGTPAACWVLGYITGLAPGVGPVNATMVSITPAEAAFSIDSGYLVIPYDGWYTVEWLYDHRCHASGNVWVVSSTPTGLAAGGASENYHTFDDTQTIQYMYGAMLAPYRAGTRTTISMQVFGSTAPDPIGVSMGVSWQSSLGG